MLLAKDENNVWVHANEATASQNYYCPDCHELLILRSGVKITRHFAHPKMCKQHMFSEGETIEHVMGKKILYDALRSLGYSVELEPYVKQLHQRPDLLVNGKYVIEFQCSGIAPDIVEKRTRNYERYHYKVIWVTGEKTAKSKSLLYYRIQGGLFQFHLNVKTKKLYAKLAKYVKEVPFQMLLDEQSKVELPWLIKSEVSAIKIAKLYKRQFLNMLYLSNKRLGDLPAILLSQRTKLFGTDVMQYEWLVWLYLHANENCLYIQFENYAHVQSYPCITKTELTQFYFKQLQTRLNALLQEAME